MTIAGFERRDIKFALIYLRMMFRDRFIGSSLGVVWAVASPVLMLGIFTFVFGFVFRSKLPGAETSLSYVIWLISGYGPWLAISEGVTTAAGSVVGNGQMIKNVKMKSELLPIAGTAMGSVPLAVAIVYLMGLMAFNGNEFHFTWLIIPLIVTIQFLMVTGVGMLCAALAVFWRDITHVLPNLLLVLMFSTPIFYPITAMPHPIEVVSSFNPIYLLSEWYRQPLLHNQFPEFWTLGYIAIFGIALFYGGLIGFRRLRPFFESRL